MFERSNRGITGQASFSCFLPSEGTALRPTLLSHLAISPILSLTLSAFDKHWLQKANISFVEPFPRCSFSVFKHGVKYQVPHHRVTYRTTLMRTHVRLRSLYLRIEAPLILFYKSLNRLRVSKIFYHFHN